MDIGSPGTLFIIGLIALISLVVGVIGTAFFYRRRIRALSQARRRAAAVRREAEKSKSEFKWDLQTIYELISALSSTLNYQRVLDSALDLSISALASQDASASRIVSAVLLFTESESDISEPKLLVGSARRFTRADMSRSFPGLSGLIASSIDEGASQLVNNVAQDPELGKVLALQTCSSGYCIPLRTGLDTYGVLLFAHPEKNYFTPDRQELLEIIANQVMIALQNARLYSDLKLEKERMMEIQEEARKKLARDLHDGPTQSVAAIAMRVNFARRLMDRDKQAASGELFKIEELARRTTKEIRHMLFTLRPLVLESQGLRAALESMAEKMRDTYRQNVRIEVDQEIIPLMEMGKQAVVFYIAEEAVNNARKHAKANNILVRLRIVGDDLTLLEIMDDGVGFDVGAVDATYEQRSSLGMVNMRERTELVNGVIRIDSAIGKGTQIQVLIPLSEDAADKIRHRL